MSISAFRSLGYDPESDTTLIEVIDAMHCLDWLIPLFLIAHTYSLDESFPLHMFCSFSHLATCVQCRPLTGRTHQLRVHLQFLGNPIANDPCYGGQLFYRDDARRSSAVSLLQLMKQRGHSALSKLPHLGVLEDDAMVAMAGEGVEAASLSAAFKKYADNDPSASSNSSAGSTVADPPAGGDVPPADDLTASCR